MNFLANLIRETRERKGLSQRQLSLLSGISNSEISRIEAGERKNPSPDTLRALAKPLGLSYESLMMAAGYLTDTSKQSMESADRILEAISSDPELREFWIQAHKRPTLKLLFKQVKDATDEDIRKIIRVIKAIEDEERE